MLQPAAAANPTAATVSLANLSPDTKAHLQRWTQDPRKFSHSVLKFARPHPLSDAYLLGSVIASEGGLFGGNAKPTQAASNVCNPAHAFRLMWHKVLLTEKIGEKRIPTAATDQLTRLHIAKTLWEIAQVAKTDSNYQEQIDRYPALTNLIKITSSIRS